MSALIVIVFSASVIWFIAGFAHHATKSICQRHKVMIAQTMDDIDESLEELLADFVFEKDLDEVQLLPDFSSFTTPQLRKVCNELDIQWRNAHGKNRHMKKSEMLAAIA